MKNHFSPALSLRGAGIVTGCLLSLALVLSISGCGSNNGDFSVNGTLTTSGINTNSLINTRAGAPLAGVSVALEGTTDFGVTDENGEFSFDSDFPGSTFNLVILGSGYSASLELTDVPAAAKSVTLALEYDAASEEVTATSVEYVTGGGSGGAEPTVAPTTVPGQPTPEPTVGPEPTAVPGQPTSAPTARPTSAPSNPTPKPTTPPANPAIARGKTLFNAQCKSCHTPASMRKRTAKQILDSDMGSYSGTQLADLVAYLASV